MTNRYNRHIILSEIGQIGQDKITKAKVLVVGAGGLGCPILQYLAAAGVGTLGIIDFDTVDITNLQRQVLFGNASIGQNKAIAAKERLTDLNSDISIITYPEPLTYQNAIGLFKEYDIIVDGSDNFETRYLVNDACVITNKPLVYGAIYKFEGQVSVFNYNNGPSYRCLFPEPPKKGTVPNCSEIGVLGVLPGIIGSMQANEVLKIVLGIGDVLSGKLLYYNALTCSTTLLKINKTEEQFLSVLKDAPSFNKKQLNIYCDTERVISLYDIINIENFQLIDVREPQELPKVIGKEVTHIPLSSLEDNLDKIMFDKENLIFCQSGVRSKQAISILKNQGINNCFSIKEGASEINDFLSNHYKTTTNDR
ncbi:molybdopterin-synthase adenylyltransferase MoeB [Flavobacteriaceae bacterium XHP0103]|uniref:molybdopterin-synthase adenylyltransferase MoeB n=1 Tax=Marixanthotalea marina TaxID=2844359 RepID=UPI002989C0ED|nr:molybdopterin-synthase adenylyltransferase MoeB [Marixanthotalea marina]MBU3821653.1 molybdopterin-synthase adenylyltransferase MoeB [Marixanthotalea marina]